MRGGGDTVSYDPFDPRLVEDPYGAYASLRDQYPLYRCAARDLWVLSRFEDVQRCARDWKSFSSNAGVDVDATGAQIGPGNFLDSDPPKHDVLRDVVRQAFSPKRMTPVASTVRGVVLSLLNSIGADESVDIVTRFAAPLPVAVMSQLLGLPDEDQGRLMGWTEAFATRTLGDPVLPPPALAALDEMQTYFREMIRWYLRNPTSGLLSTVAAAVDGSALSIDEALGVVLLLYVGGTETTAPMIGNTLVQLARHPEQRAAVVADPQLAIPCIEESLRFDAPFQMVKRTLVSSAELHGVELQRGDEVLLLYGSANRDERRFERAAEFDILREPKRHLAFGEGIHFCLGAPLARLEGRAAVELLLGRFPTYAIRHFERLPNHSTRGFVSLEIELETA